MHNSSVLFTKPKIEKRNLSPIFTECHKAGKPLSSIIRDYSQRCISNNSTPRIVNRTANQMPPEKDSSNKTCNNIESTAIESPAFRNISSRVHESQATSSLSLIHI